MKILIVEDDRVSALVRGELPLVSRVAHAGLASPEHAAFVRRLKAVAAGQAP